MFDRTGNAPGEDIVAPTHKSATIPSQTIGEIQTTTGSVSVTRLSGAVVHVEVGDLVYQGDVIETAADGRVGICFIDGTTFNLSNNARMVLSEFVFDPNGTSNSVLLSFAHGAFAFIPGKVAKTGVLRIDTPFARIRGAAQDGGIGILTLAALAFSTIREIQAASRSDVFLDDGTITYKDLPHGTYEIVTRDGRVIVHDDPGVTIEIGRAGDVARIPNSSSRMAQLTQLAQQTAALSQGAGPQGAAPGGSSTPTFDIPLQLQPINFGPPQNHDSMPQPVTINITAISSGSVEVAQLKPPPPVLVADAGLHTITEVHNVTGSTELDTASSAALSFIDLKLSTVSASLASITWSGGTTPSEVAAVLAGALSVTAESTGFDAGSITTTFGAADKNFDFLAAGETLTIIYNVTVTDNNGVSVTQPVRVIATGTNDAPVLAVDASGPYTVPEGLSTTGTLTFIDVDLNDHHTVSTSAASATWSGGATLPSGLAAVLAGALSTTTTDSTGSGSGSIAVTFSAANGAFDFLAAGQTLTITYNVTVTDNNGVNSTQPVTITIQGTNDAAVIGDPTVHDVTEDANVGNLTASGTLSITDADQSQASFQTGVTGAQDNLGSLTLQTNGNYTYTVANSLVQYLGANGTKIDTFTVTALDGTAKQISFTIQGTNDVPVIDGVSTGDVIEDVGVVAGNISTSGALSITDADQGQSNFTAQAGTLGSNGYGTFTLAANGIWTYTANDSQTAIQQLGAGQSITDSFTAVSSDGTASEVVTVTITGTNDAPVITSGAAAVAVSEEGLPNGVPDTLPNIIDTTNSPTASGTITASDAEGDALTMTLGLPSAALTFGGVAITWTLQNSNHMLVGTAGTTTIITATITDTGAYNVTLTGPIDHPVANQEDVETFEVPVTVSDGHTTTSTTLSVRVEDDSPKAEPVDVSVDTTDSKTNVMLILDVSGSMDSPSGLAGLTRLDAAKAAVNELLDQYDSRGDVMVRIVTFSGTGAAVGSAWMTVAEAKAAIAGLSADGSTNYDAALLTAMTAFTADGKLTGPGTQNVSYFLSDGDPTVGNGINPTEQDVWESFLTTNNMVSFALGIPNVGTPENLNPIAFDPASGTQLADTPIIVTNLGQLANTLVFTIPPVTGTVLTGAGGAASNSFGADGGFVQSITVDGVTYTFNPAANGGAGGITTSGGSFTYDGATKTLTVDTDTSVVGGEFAMVMTTGAFTFQRPIDFSSESVGYVLVDGDGDTASSTLHFSAAVLPAGVAGSPIKLGLTDPADHVGPVTVTIAGIPAGWTLSEGAANGYGSWTIQASNLSTLSITSPDNYAGAMAFQVTMSWTNADDSSGFARVTDNVEVFAQGAPIVAWSGDDHLTGSSGKDLFVFAQPIGHDTIYSFNAGEDQIDLIGYAGFANFNDVQRHLSEDNAGNAVLVLAAGQSITLMGVAAASVTAGNFVFDHTPVLDNAGTMTVGDGALLPLSGVIENAGTIALDAVAGDTHLQLIQNGVTLQGGGQLILSDSAHNFISGSLSGVTLTNADNTISGAGQLGAGQMTLVNDGTIVATGFHALVIDTGANVVTNNGTLAATGSLIVNGDVANSGLIWAHGGNITINGAVTGSGHAMISGAGTLGFGAASSADVTFAADAAGRLTLEHAADFTGTISGFSSDDQIDLANIGYATASLYNVTYNASTDLTTFVITDGTSTGTLHFVGNYTVHTAWHFSSDSNGGTLLTDSPLDGSAASSAELADTMATALATPDASADQFTFEGDSGAPAAGSTLVASTDPSAAHASDTTQSSPDDTTATALADANAATNTQPAATADATQPDATPQPASAPAAGLAAADTFVFAANFGNVTLANFDPGADVIEIDHTVFADFQALLAAAHYDGNGNAVITADPNDTITLKNVTVAQLVQHQGDFHFT